VPSRAAGFIRYPDGSEELYDHRTDPHQFTNLANQPEMKAAKEKLAKWMPKTWAKSLGGRLG
jgi:hypothetical protein